MSETVNSIVLRVVRGSTSVRTLFALLLLIDLSTGVARAADISVTDAWTPPNPNPGSDVLLGMVVKNDGTDADALLRVSCPVANFSESRQIDVGEGGKSAREIHSINIPGRSSVRLSNDQFQVALLQTTNPLVRDAEFVCTLSFRRGGKVQVPVKVLDKAPAA